jgi:hypothetical protein
MIKNRPTRPAPDCSRVEFLRYRIQLDAWQKSQKRHDERKTK